MTELPSHQTAACYAKFENNVSSEDWFGLQYMYVFDIRYLNVQIIWFALSLWLCLNISLIVYLLLLFDCYVSFSLLPVFGELKIFTMQDDNCYNCDSSRVRDL